MQYYKISLLVAFFSTSALALPFSDGAENDLSSREFYEKYLEARADPALEARDLESMDLEAREYLDYLKAHEVDNNVTVCPLSN